MEKIQVRVGELERSVAKLAHLADILSEQAMRTGNINAKVEQSWKSDYTAAYMEKAEMLKREISDIGKEMDRLAVSMKRAAQEIRAVEEKNRISFEAGKR